MPSRHRRRKNGGGKFTGESCKTVSIHPQAELAPPGRAIFQFYEKIGEMWTVGVDNLVVLACVLKATKKGQLFGERKVHPRENRGYTYASRAGRIDCYNSIILSSFLSRTRLISKVVMNYRVAQNKRTPGSSLKFAIKH